MRWFATIRFIFQGLEDVSQQLVVRHRGALHTGSFLLIRRGRQGSFAADPVIYVVVAVAYAFVVIVVKVFGYG